MRTWGSAARLSRLLRRNRDGVRFLLRFSAYTVVAFLALSALHDQIVIPFTHVIARLTHAILRAAGASAWVSGQSVGVPGFAVEIKNNCNAIYEICLYSAAVLAYPAPFLKRVEGALLGASILYSVNLLRVLTLIALGRYWPWGFEAAHVYVWQALFLAIVSTVWFGWTIRVHPVS